jgi:hypothetical protein
VKAVSLRALAREAPGLGEIALVTHQGSVIGRFIPIILDAALPPPYDKVTEQMAEDAGLPVVKHNYIPPIDPKTAEDLAGISAPSRTWTEEPVRAVPKRGAKPK